MKTVPSESFDRRIVYARFQKCLASDDSSRHCNEVAWWEDLRINALEMAKGLWEQSHPKTVMTVETGLSLDAATSSTKN